MKVLVAGIYRSGSTWTFNAVRLCMLQKGLKPQSIFYQGGIRPPRRDVVAKVHHWYSYLVHDFDYVVVSTRDTEEIKRSLEEVARNFPERRNPSPEHVETYLDHLNKYKRHSVYTVQYDRIKSEPVKVVSELAKALGLRVNAEKVVAELNKLRAPEHGSDPVTFMTETHIKFKA